MTPLLSVLIPTYNGERYLPFALDSILAQRDSDIECIAVDDGSSDQTLSILDQYKDKLNLTIIKQERIGNWVTNTNRALNLAHGDYVCMLHQDDIWHKDRLKIIRPLIETHPDVDLFLHAADFIDPRGRHLGQWRCSLPAYPSIINPEIALSRLLIQNFIAIPAPVFKRETAIAIGALDENLWYTADWDFWVKLALQSQIIYYPKPLCGFRIHPNSQTETRSANLSEFQRQHEIVFKRYVSRLNNTKACRDEIRKASTFSIEVNVTFAGAVHEKKIRLSGLIIRLFQLGWRGVYRYFRDSRIWERSIARIKMRLRSSH